MREQLSISQFLNHFGIIFIGMAVVVFCSCKTTYSQNKTSEVVTQAQQDFIGTWISTESGNTKWVVTDSHLKTYYKNELNETYNYEFSRESVQCEVDMSKRLEKYPWESILILADVQTEKIKCYHVYGLDQKVLSIRPFGNSTFVSFEKQ